MAATTFMVRVRIPDRPGALGQVASRIGAVRGDVVAIEILERDGGRATDELVIDLPDASLADALIREINEVDDVEVEDVRPVAGGHVDPWLDALDTASQLVGAASVDELLAALVDHAYRGMGASWVAAIGLGEGEVLEGRGAVPPAAWLRAFIDGSCHHARCGTERPDPPDVTWVPMAAAGVALLLGRDGTPLRAKERHQVAALARIADAWWGALGTVSRLSGRLAHPAGRAPSPVSVPPLDARS